MLREPLSWVSDCMKDSQSANGRRCLQKSNQACGYGRIHALRLTDDASRCIDPAAMGISAALLRRARIRPPGTASTVLQLYANSGHVKISLTNNLLHVLGGRAGSSKALTSIFEPHGDKKTREGGGHPRVLVFRTDSAEDCDVRLSHLSLLFLASGLHPNAASSHDVVRCKRPMTCVHMLMLCHTTVVARIQTYYRCRREISGTASTRHWNRHGKSIDHF